MMLEGELAYHKGDFERAFDCLRESVRRNDELAYNEPWAWMHPPRHALGALLLAQGHYDEAQEVYRTDLGLNGKLARCAQHRGNVWSLHGLVECMQAQGDGSDLAVIEEKLRQALAKADMTISSSCLCRG